MYLHFVEDQTNYYDTLPVKIRSADGTAYTNLNDMTEQERNYIGLFEYQNITEPYDPFYKTWSGEYQYDHENRTAVKVLIDRPFEQIKTEKLSEYLAQRALIRSQGYQTTTGAQLKLKVEEEDLVRWTQLMMKIMAFQAPTETVWDYYNIKHTLSSSDVVPMLVEVSTWFSNFLDETKEGQIAIETCESIECLMAL